MQPNTKTHRFPGHKLITHTDFTSANIAKSKRICSMSNSKTIKSHRVSLPKDYDRHSYLSP